MPTAAAEWIYVVSMAVIMGQAARGGRSHIDRLFDRMIEEIFDPGT